MKLNVDQSLRKAASLSARGDVSAAEGIYREVLQRFPTNRRALDGMRALTAPKDPKAYEQGVEAVLALYEQGRLREALDHLRLLIDLYPSQADLHNLAGAASVGIGQLDAAVESYDRAIGIDPAYAEAHSNRATALIGLARHDEALASCDQAIKLLPGNAQAHSNRGIALKHLGRIEEALASHDKAIRLMPDSAEIHYNRGNALLGPARLEEALAAYDRAITLRPTYVEALANRGHALRDLDRLDAALDSYSRAVALRPGYQEPLAQLAFQKARMCDWHGGPELSRIGMGTEAISPYVLVVLDDHPERNLFRAQTYVAEKFADSAPRPSPASDHSGPIRIGYFSADFHDHAVMFQLARLFELHDRSRFSVHAFSYGSPQSSPMRTRLEQAFDVFHDVHGVEDEEIAALARRQGIDIAIDLMGYTGLGRPGIFAPRAAPIQISYIGYPGTMGAPFIDYLIADDILIPDEQRRHYAEKIIHLPETYQANDDSRKISDEVMSRTDLGLPEDGFVYCCFNNSFKIGPAEFDVWMRLLARVDGSALWLLKANHWVEGNLRREAAARGIDPARLVFAGYKTHADHLARLRHADLFLDCFTCNAHATASDALWAGVPVLTVPGEAFAARAGASVVRAIGLPEMVATTREDYERMALDLARSPDRLAAIKARLAANLTSAPLFDSARFTRHMEAAYEAVCERHRNGFEPDHIKIPSLPK